MALILNGLQFGAGEAQGQILISQEPLSFWGGYDFQTGEIIDRRHPLSKQIAAGKILAIPFTRGSSTTTAVLLEAIRAGKAPAAIITTNIDRFLALASIVADELYAISIPMVALNQQDFSNLESEAWVKVKDDGKIEFLSNK
jgi:predicted aconitase with swiveling domain